MQNYPTESARYRVHLDTTTGGHGDTERGCGEAQPQRQQTARALRSFGRSSRPERAAAGLRHSRAPVVVSRCARLAAPKSDEGGLAQAYRLPPKHNFAPSGSLR
jgi:hypothetical protein